MFGTCLSDCETDLMLHLWSVNYMLYQEMYPPAHILTRYRTYLTFLRTYKSAYFITIIAFVVCSGSFMLFCFSDDCYPMPRFSFLQTRLYKVHVTLSPHIHVFNAPKHFQFDVFVQLVTAV